MKKNIYYSTVFKRMNNLKTFIYSLFYNIASWPRLVMEVFLRRDMGERYFNIASALTVFAILALIPFIEYSFLFRFYWTVIMENKVWYLFTGAYLFFSILRTIETRRNPSVFDFGKYSFSTGSIHEFFYNLTIRGKEPSVRAIEIFYEPLAFFIGGLLLVIFGQSIGLVLLFCSIVYSLSYAAAYHIGDNLVMNIIDEMIVNEATEKWLIQDKDPSSSTGFKFYAHKPSKENLRQKLYDNIVVDDASDAV